MASKYAALHEDSAPSKYAALHDDDPPASRSDAGSEYGLGFQKVGAPDEMPATSPNAEPTPERTTAEEWLPGGEQVYHARLTPEQRRGVVSTERAESDAKNWARLLALAKGATFGAAPKISRMSAKLQGLPDPAAEYEGAATEYPLQTATFQAIGSLPAALAIAPASAAAGSITAGAPLSFGGKLLTAGATGLDAALQTGLQGLLSSDAVGAEGKAYDAASQAMLGGAAGAAMSLAPEAVSSAYQLAKQGAGKAAQVPRATLDKLYAMLSGKPADVADDAARVADNVVPIRPDQSDVETKMTPIRNWLREGEYGGVGGKRDPSKFKSKQAAWDQIVNASGVDDFSKQSAQAGHFDEIERMAGRKVKDSRDAFDALVAASARKRGKMRGTHDWEDVQTAIRELKKLEGLEDLQLPSEVQEAILPVGDDVSFNFGANAKPGKDPDFLQKSGELAKMLGQADDVAAPAATKMPREAKPIDPRSKYFTYGDPHEGKTAIDRAEQAADLDIGMKAARARFMEDTPLPKRKPEAPFPEPITFPGAADPNKTNAKGGAGSFYNPMGAGVEDEAAKRARFVAETNQEALRRFPQLADARPPTESEAVSWSAALDRLRKRGLLENVETTGPRGTRVRTDVPAPQPTQALPAPAAAPAAAAPQPQTPWSLSEPYQPPKPDLGPDYHAIGKQRAENIAGAAAGAAGAAAGFASPVYGGSIAGGALGYKAGQAWARGVDKGASKLAELGQKLLTDPAKLVQLEQQGGKLGSAAAFIMDGNRTGGESAMAARAFIVASQPWWREQFAQMDEAAGY